MSDSSKPEILQTSGAKNPAGNPYRASLNSPGRRVAEPSDPRRRLMGTLCYAAAFVGSASLPIVGYVVTEIAEKQDGQPAVGILLGGTALLVLATLFFAALGSRLRHGGRSLF